jgi:hypothetical protein
MLSSLFRKTKLKALMIPDVVYDLLIVRWMTRGHLLLAEYLTTLHLFPPEHHVNR